MIATIKYKSKTFKIDLTKPLDVSIAVRGDDKTINAWYLDTPKIVPHEQDGFTGSVLSGSAVNFNNISFNPHSHVTHTETVGHITEEIYSINKYLDTYFFLAEVITVAPERAGDDFVISKNQMQYAIGNKKRDAVLIRTLPNTNDKLTKDYSNTNPPYLLEDATIYLREKGIKHLLIDLPSVDRERDEGRLLSHNAFWNTSGKLRLDATITEFIFVPNSIEDGMYVLNLQVAPFENDASPSRPVLYKPLI